MRFTADDYLCRKNNLLKKLLTYGFWGIVVSYCVFYLAYILYFAVDFPIQDDLLFILLIEDFNDTGFSFTKIPYFLGELFRVDNDHCLMVPRVINLLNYAVSKSLNFKFQIVLIAGFTIGLLILYYQQFKLLSKPLWKFLPVVFFLLQPQYYEVSLWALAGLEHVGVTLFLVGALISFQQDRVTLGLILATLGTFTSGNGIFIFAAVGLFILLEQQYRKLILLLLIFLGNVLILFFIYKKGQQNNLAESLSHLPQLFAYFLFLSGSIWEGLIASKWLSIISGIVILFTFFYFTVRKLRRHEFVISSLFLAVVAFNLITLALVALSRFNVGQMETASRYQYYTCLLFCSVYMIFVSAKSTILKNRLILPLLLILSFGFNAISYYSTTETVAYNKLSYLADTENWRAEENMFYIKPDFVNLVRPYFAETIANGIWEPKSKFDILQTQNCEDLSTGKLNVFEQHFESDSTAAKTDQHYFVLEVKDLPIQPKFGKNWYVLITQQNGNKRYILPIRFLANGKINILKGESYFRNFGYLKVFQDALPAGSYNVKFLFKSEKTLCWVNTYYELKVLDNEVVIE